MNTPQFIKDQQLYFAGAHKQFLAFGGPCVYFHRECLLSQEREFLSDRHIEMLYATLTAWGMHRRGDVETTKTKLTEFERFSGSIKRGAEMLAPLREFNFLESSERDYAAAVSGLEPFYRGLQLSVSAATIVVNSKAIYHLLPNLVPPIDRQYTVRFFGQPPTKWRTANGKFRTVPLPKGHNDQFALFVGICTKAKRLASQIDPALFDVESRDNRVTAVKAIDNAIVNYVRIVSGGGPRDD